MRHTLIILCIIISTCKIVLAKDYSQYHSSINTAEYEIFVNKRFDSGLKIYERTFREFDFVFANDCITAMQIAVYSKNEKLFLNFVGKSFENGVKLSDIDKIKYISQSRFYFDNKNRINELYRLGRPIYTRRINVRLLHKMYELYAHDQLVKNKLKNQSKYFKSGKTYPQLISATIDELVHLCVTYGIPSDRLIGIDQNDIMAELKSTYPDLCDYYYQNVSTCETVISLGQFVQEEQNLCSHLILPIMHHYDNSFTVFSTEFYLQEIKKGNIHPKDIAAINDFPYGGYEPKKIKKNGVYFGVGARFVPPNSLCISDSMINQNRKMFLIQKIEYDRAKWDFMQ